MKKIGEISDEFVRCQYQYPIQAEWGNQERRPEQKDSHISSRNIFGVKARNTTRTEQGNITLSGFQLFRRQYDK